MLSFELNAICECCGEIEAVEQRALLRFDAAQLRIAARLLVREKGWLIDIQDGHIRVLCPECARDKSVRRG